MGLHEMVDGVCVVNNSGLYSVDSDHHSLTKKKKKKGGVI